MILTQPIREPSLRRAALALYSRVWPDLPDAIAQAQRWESDWFEWSTPTFVTEGERMVAHAGQVWCDLWIEGARERVAALHGVLVDPEFRGRGLGRAVIEAALARLDAMGVERVILWSEKVAFYDRFGFRPARESMFRCEAPVRHATGSRPLDLDDSEDVRILRRLLASRSPVSNQCAAGDDGWHFLIDCAIDRPQPMTIRYLSDLDAAVVAEPSDSTTLRIFDVIAERLPGLAEIVGAFDEAEPFQFVELLFSPDRFASDAVAVPHPDPVVQHVRGRDLLSSAVPEFALSPYSRT